MRIWGDTLDLNGFSPPLLCGGPSLRGYINRSGHPICHTICPSKTLLYKPERADRHTPNPIWFPVLWRQTWAQPVLLRVRQGMCCGHSTGSSQRSQSISHHPQQSNSGSLANTRALPPQLDRPTSACSLPILLVAGLCVTPVLAYIVQA